MTLSRRNRRKNKLFNLFTMSTNQPLSKCHGAEIIETCGGRPHEGATWWHECTKCRQPCDPQTDVAQRTEQDVSKNFAGGSGYTCRKCHQDCCTFHCPCTAGSSPDVNTSQGIVKREANLALKIAVSVFMDTDRDTGVIQKSGIKKIRKFLYSYGQLCREEGRREQIEKDAEMVLRDSWHYPDGGKPWQDDVIKSLANQLRSQLTPESNS